MSVKDIKPASAAFKPKKSVALSGTTAGETAVCTVGNSGNDLHYRGYDIRDLAANCGFEEVAHLLVHGKLPNSAELAAYQARLIALRELPAEVRRALELLPPTANPVSYTHLCSFAIPCASLPRLRLRRWRAPWMTASRWTPD